MRFKIAPIIMDIKYQMKNNFNYSRYLVIVYCMSVAFIEGDSIINKGTVKILADTEVNMHFDYINDGTYTNDGVMHIHKNLINNDTYTNDGVMRIYKNLINNGTIKFTDGKTTGITQFLGTDQQSIDGSGTSEYYNIQFNKTSGSISLTKKINIFGEIYFTNGIVQVDDKEGLVIFQDNAICKRVLDSSFVDGKVRKIGNQEFTFPIGDEKDGNYIYRMAKISALNNADDNTFDAEYFWENSDSIHLHNSKKSYIEFIDNVEYWKIDRIYGNSNVKVTLSWNEATTPQNIIEAADEGKLGIVRWNGSEWINEGGVVDTKTPTITTTPKDYGIFTLGIIDSTLDTDGDGVADLQEDLDDTGLEDFCDFFTASVTQPRKPEFLNGDCDNDGVKNRDEGPTEGEHPLDTDGDGIPNYLDPDDDGDGIDTIDEDIDGDKDPTNDDTDGDGISNYLDPDDDGDSIYTIDEDIDGDKDPTNDDADGDGIANYLDPDDDGDGIDTIDEDIDGDKDPINDDTDGDGIPDYLDSDNIFFVSNAFTPNGDKINDLFEIEDIVDLFPNFKMEIVNRYGNIVYSYKHNGDPKKTPIWWDGTSNGKLNLIGNKLPTGTYYYIIYFNSKNIRDQTGWVYLKR